MNLLYNQYITQYSQKHLISLSGVQKILLGYNGYNVLFSKVNSGRLTRLKVYLLLFLLIRQIVNPKICNPIYIYIYIYIGKIRLVCWSP